jgi:hypothetical protein
VPYINNKVGIMFNSEHLMELCTSVILLIICVGNFPHLGGKADGS